MLYALLGAAFAFNIRGVSDRAAEAYRGKQWLLRQIGRDNAAAWRAGGLIMVAFGVDYCTNSVQIRNWPSRRKPSEALRG
jgi:hypothetical protein